MSQTKQIMNDNEDIGISRKARGKILGGKFQGCTIWFTGLSGAGKSTIAFGVEKYLVERGIPAYTLDGDNIRNGLNKDLGFSFKERGENIRRVAEVAKLFSDSGIIVLSSFISPFKVDRNNAKNIHNENHLSFFECFVDTPLEICELRDTKGLYKKAREGLIRSFTGIDQIYEKPENPDLVIKTHFFSINTCIQFVIQLLLENQIIEANNFKPQQLFGDRKSFHALIHDLFFIELNSIDLNWVQVLSEGWATPLKGFMREKEYLSCLHFGSIIVNDKIHNQSIPIVLSIDDEKKKLIQKETLISLKFKNNIIGILKNIEIYPHRKRERCARIFGCINEKHPTIKLILESGDWLVGGDLVVFERIVWNDGLDKYRLTPTEIKSKLEKMNADVTFVFQLRNPIHNGHALLINDTREMLKKLGYKNPVLLLHPLGGWTKDDDVPLNVRINQHIAILEENILDSKSTLISIFPSPMSYAGPKEVQWHAKARIHTGSNYYIVGRDPAGINDPDTNDYLYEPMDGGKVLEMTPGLNNLKIIPFRMAAYDKVNKKMLFFDPERKSDFELISGTKMRKMALNKENPPSGFMGEKAWKILADYYNS